MKNKRFFLIALVILFVCPFIGQEVKAAETRQIIQTNGIIYCMEGNTSIKESYVTVSAQAGRYNIVKPCTKNSVIYYFNADGKGSIYTGTGFIGITYNGKRKTYYSKVGKLLTNQIVGSKKEGYFYVDTTGIKITDKTVKYAVSFVRKHTKTSDSRAKKLSKCYTYLWKHFKYSRVYGGAKSRALNPKASDMSKIAKGTFKSKRGNCHRYAACFAYIARVLGYDSKVVVGSITGHSTAWTPHGWTMVRFNKKGKKYKWYLCDPDMELNNVHVYMASSHSCSVKKKWTCTLKIKDGKVIWK